MGSFVEHIRERGGLWQARVKHAAASGFGPDKASFTTYYTKIKADGVSFQAGLCELLISSVEERLTPINASVTVKLAPELEDKEVRTVVLNGFDLHAVGDADKLITLVLEVREPRNDGGTSIEFKIRGGFRVDCSSPECDTTVKDIRKGKKHTWPESLRKLYACLRLAYNKLPAQKAEHQEKDLWGSDDDFFKSPNHDQVLVPDVVPPLDEVVFYRLFVHYLIVAGERDHLNVKHGGLPDKKMEYEWDDWTELRHKDVKEQNIDIAGVEDYAGGVHAFKQIAMSFYRKSSKGGFIKWWRNAKAMHLLDWHIAITDGGILEPGKRGAIVDLLFKNWTRWMILSRPLYSLLAYRDAGHAQFDCRLTLLRFKECEKLKPGTFEGEIKWPSGKLISFESQGWPKFFVSLPSTDKRASKFKRVPLEK
jgi:hypothetical protein